MPTRTCAAPGCGRPVHAAGLCRGHYARRGTPDALAPLRAKRAAHQVESMGGVKLSVGAAEAFRAYAREHGTSVHAVMVDVLERWAKKQGRASEVPASTRPARREVRR